ncbi:MAG: DUF4271 domain-containing protein [Chitinophagales bacterium]
MVQVRWILSFCAVLFLSGHILAQNNAHQRDTDPPEQQAPVQVVAPPQIHIIKPVDTVAILRQFALPSISYDSLLAAPTGPQEQGNSMMPHETHREIAMPLILLILLIGITWLRVTYRREYGENFTVLLNAKLGLQISRDREFSANIFKWLTFLEFAAVLSLSIFFISKELQYELPGNSMLIRLGLLFLSICILYFGKGITYRLLAAVYGSGAAFSFFRFNALVIYQLAGLILFPVVVLAAFAPQPVQTWSVYTLIVILCIALIIRLIKGFSVLQMLERFHILYFLLYICALEIAPLLILITLFGSRS